MKTTKVVVIVGPTAVGKSAIAVKLARRFGGEIISADSRQVYRDLDIGTGKITRKEMWGVPHHLLDVASPRTQFTVARFTKLAKKALRDIESRGKLPVVVGGTGLYIDALFGKVAVPEVPPNLKLRRQLEKKTAERLFTLLQRLDARRALVIDRHNSRRLIRAIEIAKALGKVPVHSAVVGNSGMDPLYIGLSLPSEELRKKILVRLFARISEQGMIEEAQKLHQQGLSWKRMEALGLEYRYLKRYIKNEISKGKMVEELQKEIYRYAKRQMTWFRRNEQIRWFNPRKTKEIVHAVSKFLRR